MHDSLNLSPILGESTENEDTVIYIPEGRSGGEEGIERVLTKFLLGDQAKQLFSDIINAAVTQAVLPLTTRLTALEEDNAQLRNELTHIKAQLYDTQQSILSEAIQTRRNNLVLSTSWTEAEDPASKVISFMRDTLQLPPMIEDIIECCRIGREPRGQPQGMPAKSRPILIKFRSFRAKRSFLQTVKRRRTGSMTPPVYVTVDTVPQERELFHMARQLKIQKRVGDTWIGGGRAWVKLLDGRKQIIGNKHWLSQF